MLLAQTPMVYALGKRGANLLATVKGAEREKIDWQIQNWQDANRDAGLTYIEHSLMISRFRVALRVALRSLPHMRPQRHEGAVHVEHLLRIVVVPE